MNNEVQAVIFDIDGVITDGKKYTDGTLLEIKSITYKDMDAINALKNEGILVGCISGEDTAFSKKISEDLDYCSLGTKNKRTMLEELSSKYNIESRFICYIGDGKYDIEALEYAGVSVCPHDAIFEAKRVADIVLDTPGGCGCIAELYTRLHQMKDKSVRRLMGEYNTIDTIKKRINSHCNMAKQVLNDEDLLYVVNTVCKEIINSYRNNGQLFLCGNGGSAADAQHLAAELIGRFYLERQAYSAEALSTNTSIITALANDYDYDMIFARQVEAKGRKNDVLIGITTSGKSPNILKALKRAKELDMVTVLMSGKINESIPSFNYADYVIGIPSDDTPRIQEGHILIGHIMCEIIESELTREKEKNE